MSLIVKIMSAENAPDADPCKGHILAADVRHVVFDRDTAGRAWAAIWRPGDSLDEAAPERFAVTGNAYVMNEAGRTISSFAGMTPNWHTVPEDLAA